MAKENEENLPLSANIKKIRARHYILLLYPHLQSKMIYAKLILIFSLPTKCESIGKVCQRKCGCNIKGIRQDFDSIILDMKDLHIQSVDKLVCPDDALQKYVNPMIKKCSREESLKLFGYSVIKHKFECNSDYLKIDLDSRETCSQFAMQITYHTLPEGNSLIWGNSGNDSPCVFTAGSCINNRSLLPYQDAPGAMATWETHVYMSSDKYHVSISSDETSQSSITTNLNEKYSEIELCNHHKLIPQSKITFTKHHYFYTCMILPIATMALAIGNWKLKNILFPKEISNLYQNKSDMELVLCDHVPYICLIKDRSFNDSIDTIPITVVYEQIIEEKLASFFDFIPYCCSAASQLFGPHPCSRLEIVILPKTFSSLGLTSPNMIFFNPSVVMAGDSFTFLNLCHEIGHAWFGVIIGSEDWAEEWISEGFATFFEEIIYARAVKLYKNFSLPKYSSNLFSETADLNSKPSKYMKVCSNPNSTSSIECHNFKGIDNIINIEEEVLCNLKEVRDELRYRQLLQEIESYSAELMTLQPKNESNDQFVLNGQNKDKMFLTVHYLKGYFFLKYLSKNIGEDEFITMLRKFIFTYHGQLITSEDFVNFTYRSFPNVLKISKEELIRVWLVDPTIITENYLNLITKNNLHIQCNENKSYIINKTENKLILKCLVILKGPEQIRLFFEYLLEYEKPIRETEMKKLFDFYDIEKLNCEVQHSWCELVIKHNYKPGKKFVKNFLITEFAMGIYLYGELMISKRSHWNNLAKVTYEEVNQLYTYNTRECIQKMIFPDL